MEINKKMSYSEFEWMLCNRVFTMAVFSPFEYSGITSLIIQDWGHIVIMITCNREGKIRVSYPDAQVFYDSYDAAYAGICSWKKKR